MEESLVAVERDWETIKNELGILCSEAVWSYGVEEDKRQALGCSEVAGSDSGCAVL